MQSFMDGMALVGSLVVMVLVIVLTYYVSRWYAGRMSKTYSGKNIKIVDRVSAGPGCTLIVVQAGNMYYLVGLSEKNMQMLCELRDFEPVYEETGTGAPFRQVFEHFLSKAGKNSDQKGDGGEK